MQNFVPSKPTVELLAYTAKPFDLAVASAKTCYSANLVYTDSVTEGQRERIGISIFEAGHHTPFQHPTFVFGIKGVSRQCVWSFLHSHPFYNSDQQSQRYVVLDEIKVFVPQLEHTDRKIYENAVLEAFSAYGKLSEILKNDNYKLMANIGRIKGQEEKAIKVESEKKAIEMARYVVPVCATCDLYHTVSGVTLHRYKKMINACDCPQEAKLLVDQMIEEVRKIDTSFFDKIGEPTLDNYELIENTNFEHDPDFAKNFDKELDGKMVKLTNYDKDGEKNAASMVRDVLGAKISDDKAIDILVNPARNKYLISTLNCYAHSPLMRVLHNINYTFKKKISHTADSQDQRHRMTPANRPLLRRVHTEKPDFITPYIIKRNEEALALYTKTMKILWDAKNKLIKNGVPTESACYLLPNAVALRYTQTGSLLNLLHKWRLRTCFNAQLEIYDLSMEELKQVLAVHPKLAKYVGPPCRTRFLAGLGSGKPCPEGPRWCGISVWLNFPNVTRPF